MSLPLPSPVIIDQFSVNAGFIFNFVTCPESGIKDASSDVCGSWLHQRCVRPPPSSPGWSTTDTVIKLQRCRRWKTRWQPPVGVQKTAATMENIKGKGPETSTAEVTDPTTITQSSRQCDPDEWNGINAHVLNLTKLIYTNHTHIRMRYDFSPHMVSDFIRIPPEVIHQQRWGMTSLAWGWKNFLSVTGIGTQVWVLRSRNPLGSLGARKYVKIR